MGSIENLMIQFAINTALEALCREMGSSHNLPSEQFSVEVGRHSQGRIWGGGGLPDSHRGPVTLTLRGTSPSTETKS